MQAVIWLSVIAVFSIGDILVRFYYYVVAKGQELFPFLCLDWLFAAGVLVGWLGSDWFEDVFRTPWTVLVPPLAALRFLVGFGLMLASVWRKQRR